MDDSIITQAVVTLSGGFLLGVVLGGFTGWLKGFTWGVAIGCLTIGAAGLAGAGWLGWHRYHSLAGTEVAQGVLMEWIPVRSTDDTNRVSISHAPVVRFTARDGNTYRTRGLARGEKNDLEPGSAMPVRYRIDDPNQALVGDFQNLWSGVWGLGLFGVIPLMMGAFFFAMSIGEARATRNAGARMRRPPPSLQRSQLVRKFFIAGSILLVAALFVAPHFAATALEAIGLMFLTIFAGCAALACATVLRGDDWQTPAILLILATSFGLFGMGAYMLG